MTEQKLYSHLLIAARKLGPPVYDGDIPGPGTPYPFIYLGESQISSSPIAKGGLFADVRITFHVWHNDWHQRGTVSATLADLKRICFQTGFVSNCSTQILGDDTTDVPLMHGILDVTFRIREDL